VSGRVVALAARVATPDHGDPSTLAVRRRSPAASASGEGVHGGVPSHQRPSTEPPAALGARVTGPGAVPFGDVLAQLRFADEGQPAALERPVAALVHRRAVTSQVVFPVRRVPTVDARVRLRRSTTSGFNHLVAPLSIRRPLSIRPLTWRRTFPDNVTGVSIGTVSVDPSRLHRNKVAENFQNPSS